MSHNTTLTRSAGATLETIVRRILRTFDVATSEDLAAGESWYDEAGDLASNLARSSGVTREQAAAVISHLSPRTSWTRNVASATYLLVYGERMDGVIESNYLRARASLGFEDPLASFGPTAPKTANFARNILGDEDAVTVDVWAARVAGVAETHLSRKGVYDAVAHAYRLAARRRGVSPATMQATTWVVARSGRAS